MKLIIKFYSVMDKRETFYSAVIVLFKPHQYYYIIHVK